MERESLGKRFARFIVLLVTVFGIAMAVIVTGRFSDETLAFIVGGAFVALLIAVPFGGLIVLALAYLRVRQSRPSQSQPYQMPPIILQMPPQLPYYQGGGNGYHDDTHTGQRDWAVIGAED